MNINPFVVISAVVLSSMAIVDCRAEDSSKQSAAGKQVSKARDYATRPDKDGSPDPATASSASGQKEGEKLPLLDGQAVEKAAKEMGENWKKLDKVLDNF